MGVCELHLEKDGDAIAHFQQYVSEGGDKVPPELRAQAERDIATLSASLVHVTISVDPVGAILVDERTPAMGPVIVNRYSASQSSLTLGIRPGHHKFTVTSDGRAPKVWTFEATPGATLSAEFRLEAKTPRSPPTKPVAAPRPSTPGKRSDSEADHVPVGEYVGFGATGMLLGGAIVTGLLAHGKKNDFMDLNDGRHEAEAKARRDEAGRLILANGVLLVGVVVTGSVTAYFHYSRRSKVAGGHDVRAASEHHPSALRVRPELRRRSGGLTLSGEF